MDQEADRSSANQIDNRLAIRAQPVRFFKAWFLFMLLSSLCSAGAGFLVGAIAGGIMGAAGMEMAKIMRIGQLLGFLVSLPISFVCFRWATTRFILPQLQFATGEKSSS